MMVNLCTISAGRWNAGQGLQLVHGCPSPKIKPNHGPSDGSKYCGGGLMAEKPQKTG